MDGLYMFIRENPIKIDDFGVPPFQEIPRNHSRNGISTLEAPSLETSTTLARRHWKSSWVARNLHLRMPKQPFKR